MDFHQARAMLEWQVELGEARQRVGAFDGSAVEVDILIGQIENRGDVLGVQVLDTQKMGLTKRHRRAFGLIWMLIERREAYGKAGI